MVWVKVIHWLVQHHMMSVEVTCDTCYVVIWYPMQRLVFSCAFMYSYLDSYFLVVLRIHISYQILLFLVLLWIHVLILIFLWYYGFIFHIKDSYFPVVLWIHISYKKMYFIVLLWIMDYNYGLISWEISLVSLKPKYSRWYAKPNLVIWLSGVQCIPNNSW